MWTSGHGHRRRRRPGPRPRRARGRRPPRRRRPPAPRAGARRCRPPGHLALGHQLVGHALGCTPTSSATRRSRRWSATVDQPPSAASATAGVAVVGLVAPGPGRGHGAGARRPTTPMSATLKTGYHCEVDEVDDGPAEEPVAGPEGPVAEVARPPRRAPCRRPPPPCGWARCAPTRAGPRATTAAATPMSGPKPSPRLKAAPVLNVRSSSSVQTRWMGPSSQARAAPRSW